MKKVFLGIGVTLFFIICISMCVDGSSETESSSIQENSQGKTEKVKVKSNWEYSEFMDQMEDDTTYIASIESENSVDFEFPYNGGSYMTLSIRKSPQYGNDVYIKIDKGQFNSDYMLGSNVKLKFDDEKAFSVSAKYPSDGSTDMLFIGNYNKLLPKIKAAKTLKIQAEFFMEGNNTFIFDIENFVWEH